MPGVRMPVLIEQVRRAVGWLRDNAPALAEIPAGSQRVAIPQGRTSRATSF